MPLNIGAPKYIQQILMDLRGKIDRNTVIVGDFNSPLTSIDRFSRQKINKATEILKETIEKLDIIDIFSILYPKKHQNTHSSQVCMEYSQESTTYWETKLNSTNLGA